MQDTAFINRMLENVKINLKDAGDKVCTSEWGCEQATFPYDSIGFVNKGQIFMEVNGVGTNVTEGGLYYIPAGLSYSHRVITPTADVFWTHFEMTLGGENASHRFVFPVSLMPEDPQYARRIFTELFQKPQLGYPLLKTGLMYELTAYFFSLGEIKTKGDERLEKMQKVTEYIEKNLDKPLTVESLAAMVGLAPGYFIECFKSFFHGTPIQFVLSRREAAARDKLENTVMSVKQIAITLGFTNQNYFSEFIKKRTGYSPLEYRALKVKSSIVEEN